MIIENSQLEDIDTIFQLYDIATAFQKKKGAVEWPVFNRSMVDEEIKNLQQWKIVIDHKIACVWAIAESDPQIWLHRNEDPAIYIHRIATHPDFRGQNLVDVIVKWSHAFAKAKKKMYIRMDTVGENIGLIEYYKKCGFDFLGLSELTDTKGLPAHYHNATVSLFQMTA